MREKKKSVGQKWTETVDQIQGAFELQLFWKRRKLDQSGFFYAIYRLLSFIDLFKYFVC